MLFDDDEDLTIERTPEHKLRHNLFGILVCTGMAHLVMTTFEIPNISYIRVFLVGFVYACLSVTVKLGHKNSIHHTAIAATFSMVSAAIEFKITGSHYVATSLMIFDLIVVYFYTQYLKLINTRSLDRHLQGENSQLDEPHLDTDSTA